MSNDLIKSYTFETASSSYQFVNIPQTYRQLYIIWEGRTVSGSGLLQFNSETNSYYNRGIRSSNGTVATATGDTNGVYLGETAIDSAYKTAGHIYINHYTSNTMKQAVVKGAYIRNSTTDYYGYQGSGRHATTSAITSLTFTTTSGANWVAGSKVQLYGIE